MKKTVIAVMMAAATLIVSAAAPTLTPKDGYPRFALGADVSWTPYIEANSLHTYYRGTDVQPDQITTIPAMVADHGIDAVRLRVWVDPTTEMAMAGFTFMVDGYTFDEMSTYGTCSVDEMTALATRFAAQGQRVMVSFQLSDTWADPGRQFIPESWAGCTGIGQLSDHVTAHITRVLSLLREANVNVAWVQIGNETNTGMLKWEMPSASGQAVASAPCSCEISQGTSGASESTKNFVKVFTDAANAARQVYPDTKIVLHLTKTAQWTRINWTLSLLTKAGFSSDICDYVGLSLYPGIDDGRGDYTGDWRTYADQGIATINNIYTTYGFRTILCEIGMNNEYSLSADTEGISKNDLQACYIDQCNRDVRAFTEYLIANLATDTSTCDGLFYWEPETDYMKDYTKGACVSVTPGPKWPRDRVTANDWWKVVSEHSDFPAGGLVEYEISGDPTPGFVPDPDLNLYIYYFDPDARFEALATSDGLLYTLTGFAAPQWFNFKLVNDDLSIMLGNAEVGLNISGYLNTRNDWNAWTATAVSATDHWWYRHDTREMTITSDDECPWPSLNALSPAITDDASAEYYNLQGMRVHTPAHGIFIMKTGRRISKVRLP